MKLCVISTTVMIHPPVGYSGLEMLAWQIAKGLTAKGHDVTLVAPRGSTFPNLHETTLGETERRAWTGYKEKLSGFDCIIDHSWEKWSYMAGLKVPILGVCHAPINTMYQTAPPVEKPCLVAISNDQGQAIEAQLKRSARVAYNGVDVDFYKPNGKPRSKRYLFLARFSSIKGPDIAVNVAKKCNVPLDLVGDDKLTGEPDLVKMIKEQCTISPGLRYIGPQTREECVTWFNRCKTLLHCNERFKEPFGLAPVEAQLCGSPVIAWDNGAMRETIKQGETGFLVKTQAEMEELIKADATATIKPERCRDWASQFSYQKMIDRYEELCKEAMEVGW